ncbi:MAG: HypC/HybG/HupF family hydrogenase formation chaperone [Deltaproteobacteria bacterium]|nr:HypC/HybG/HupF family hydrogenase formation chaperone [Deltaproteobacteria bacterium]
MCLAVPMLVVSLDGDMAVCELDNVRREASVAMIENPQVGDFVLIHAGFAIEKLDQEEAEENLVYFRDMIARGELVL